LLVDDTAEEKKEWVLTGAKDGSVLVHDIRSGKQVVSVKAHTNKKVTSALWVDKGANKGKSFITASVDKTIKVWNLDLDRKGNLAAKAEYTIKGHTAEVSGLSLHPTGDYVISTSYDSTWAFNDIESGKQLMRISDPETIDGGA
jgi:pre-mRNA-processing factor 19